MNVSGDYTGSIRDPKLIGQVSPSKARPLLTIKASENSNADSRPGLILKKFIHPSKPPLELMEPILIKLKSRSKLMSNYKGLDQEIMDCIKAEKNPSIREDLCKVFYNGITQRFREIEHRKDSYLEYGIKNDAARTARSSMEAEWVQKGDLLDALDVLHLINPEAYPLLEVTATASSNKEWNEESIPLVSYSKIEQATENIGSKTLKRLSDVQKTLPYAEVELTGTAKWVRRFADCSNPVRVFSSFYRILTRLLGSSKIGYHKKGKNVIKAISQFSLGMNIKSFEILCKKTADPKKDLFYYRGPKHLFGSTLHDYQSINQWFKRDQTSDARTEYMSKVIDAEEQIEVLYGKEASDNSYVISNSDARLRSHIMKPGHLGDPQELTGKVLSDEAAAHVSKGDNPLYYSNKTKTFFSFKNLIGREAGDSIGIMEIPKEWISSLKAARGKADAFIEKSSFRKILGSFVDRALQRISLPSGAAVVNEGLHELLGGFYRFFQKAGATQIIQRLAPADVHNYVASLDGQPLSHKEAAVMLKEKLEKSLKRLKDNPKKMDEIEKEIKHLKDIIEIFHTQEEILGQTSQTTIDIIGTRTEGNQSVSTPAIRNQSRILAQNDRKIMIFKHKDGSFSMHVFIGATGVNKVDVDESNAPKNRGDRQGDMQFGRDVYTAEGQVKGVEENMTRDGIKKLRKGERAGRFPITGSTVISYYLPTDFTIIPEIQAFKARAAYGEGAKRAEIEILANMGDPIMVKTEITMAQTLEKCFGNDFYMPEATEETILTRIETLNEDELSRHFSGAEKENLLQIRKIIMTKEQELSDDELALKGKLNDTIASRLKVINGDRNILTDLFRGVDDVGLVTLRDMDLSQLDAFAQNSTSPRAKQVAGKLKVIIKSLKEDQGNLSKADALFKEELIVFLENRLVIKTGHKQIEELGLFEGLDEIDDIELPTSDFDRVLLDLRDEFEALREVES